MTSPLPCAPAIPWRPPPTSSPVNVHASLSQETYADACRLGNTGEVLAVMEIWARWGQIVGPPEDLGGFWYGTNLLAQRVITRLFTEDARSPGVLAPRPAVWAIESGRRDGWRRGYWVTATLSRELHAEIRRRRGLLTHSEYTTHLILQRAGYDGAPSPGDLP